MADRRTYILDAALELLGSQGLRALTHRAVDAAADLPPGSVSNVFRTRADLVAAMLDHLLARELALWAELSGSAGPPPDTRGQAIDAVVPLLAAAVRAMSGPARGLTLAQQALFHEAAFEPGLQERILAARARLVEQGLVWFAGRGLTVDASGILVLLVALNGILAYQAVGPDPDPDIDPDALLRVVLDAIAA